MMFCVISSAIVSMFNTPTAITGTMLISVVAVTWAGVMLRKESTNLNLSVA
jgi:hypothetical protein